ncbi:MAG: hypothetical protein GAK28_00695 [Luteibacter sp.]|nr:MAG: hypothetical protein GAK28_00695 [Luteibacter sp.]
MSMDTALYVTPAQLAEKPGARELAQVATRTRDAIVPDALMDATLRGSDRSAWTVAQLATADEALARIMEAIQGAQGIIDGFLARTRPLPLPKVPSVVTVWARAITRYQLHGDRSASETDDPIVRDYKDALKFLQLTADGKFSLGLDDPVLTDPQLLDVRFKDDERVFDRAQMRHFR